MLTLKELAAKYDQLQPVGIPDGSPYKPAHACAAVLHGWTRFEYHYGEIKLSDEDYRKALDAALVGKTHAAAIPKIKTTSKKDEE